MKITICDDTLSDLKDTENIINKYAKANNIKIDIEKHNHPANLISQIAFKPEEYRVFFLDIVMQKNGIDVAKEIRNHCKDAIIVFTTSSKEFAIDAFEVNAYHYLLKPLEKKKVFECIDNIINNLLASTPNVIQIKTNDKNIVTIDVKDISYIESLNRRIALHLKNDEVVISTSLRAKFLESIPFDYENCGFINCHASYIVNMNDVKGITDKAFIMKNGQSLPISKNLFSYVKKTYIQYLVGE